MRGAILCLFARKEVGLNRKNKLIPHFFSYNTANMVVYTTPNISPKVIDNLEHTEHHKKWTDNEKENEKSHNC